MAKLLDMVELTTDMPAHGLKAGARGTVVMVHAGGQALEVEFLDQEGWTKAVETLRAELVRVVTVWEPRQGKQKQPGQGSQASSAGRLVASGTRAARSKPKGTILAG